MTAERYVTRRLAVETAGSGWRRALVLERAASGVWTCTGHSEGDLDRPEPGVDPALLAGTLDCDLGLSPLTNSMPVLRHRLHESGGPMDFLMAWVAVPELSVRPSQKQYTFVRREPRGRIVRFQSLDIDFTADIAFDDRALFSTIRALPG